MPFNAVNGLRITILRPSPTQIGFCTPSARTKETPGIKNWEVVENDGKLDTFATTC